MTSPELVCPVCRQALQAGAGELGCPSCDRVYPIVAGIADLRLQPDRYLDLEADRAKARHLDAVPGTYEDLVRAYWAQTPEVPRALADRYTRAAVEGEARAGVHLGRISPVDGRQLLDVGCGTGGLVVAAARRGAQAVGVDIALRWLVVARRRAIDAGVPTTFVAADGGLLPFRAGAFQVVTCIETVEHTSSARDLVQGVLRATTPEGCAYIVTANRFSVAPEPTVGLFGVGYLPRRVAPHYVRWRRQTRYQFFRASTPSGLRALAGLRSDVTVGPAVLPPVSGGGQPGPLRHAFGWLSAHRWWRAGLAPIAPYIELVAGNGRDRRR